MLSYSLNRIMIRGIILREGVVNAGCKSICIKVRSTGRCSGGSETQGEVRVKIILVKNCEKHK